MATPQKPNFIPGTGQLATFRSDFQAHLQGVNPAGFTDFRHQANQIDLATTITINGTPVSNVQSAISTIAANLTPTIPNATTSSLGLIQLSADLGGTATAPSVIRLRGFPISNTTPVVGNFLTWNGSSWTPSNTVNGNLSVSGAANITGSLTVSNFIIPSSGTLTISNTAALNVASGGVFNLQSGSSMAIKNGSSMDVQGNGSITFETGTVLRLLPGSTFNSDNIFTQNTLGNLILQSRTDSTPFITLTPWQGTANTQLKQTALYQGVIRVSSSTSVAYGAVSIPLPTAGSTIVAQVLFNAKNITTPPNASSGIAVFTAANNAGSIVTPSGGSTVLSGISHINNGSPVANNTTPIFISSSGTNVLIGVQNAAGTYVADWTISVLVSIN